MPKNEAQIKYELIRSTLVRGLILNVHGNHPQGDEEMVIQKVRGDDVHCFAFDSKEHRTYSKGDLASMIRDGYIDIPAAQQKVIERELGRVAVAQQEEPSVTRDYRYNHVGLLAQAMERENRRLSNSYRAAIKKIKACVRKHKLPVQHVCYRLVEHWQHTEIIMVAEVQETEKQAYARARKEAKARVQKDEAIAKLMQQLQAGGPDPDVLRALSDLIRDNKSTTLAEILRDDPPF